LIIISVLLPPIA